MSLVPDEHFSPRLSFNFAPMVDFLFIVIAIFAVVAITRKALYDADVNLVKHDAPNIKASPRTQSHTVNLSISAQGEYKWLDASEEQTFKSIQTVKETLLQHVDNPSQNQILLHIDQDAQWTSIAKLIFAMHEEGFTVYPVYEKRESKPFIIKN
ncbi:ExbD/TolR family protein [Simkania sp.]|uniref:ExbD/TolR family protein n=1 Tax=Simkania sp. TaxID=34094 RepID=UPI003B5159B1